MRLLFTTSDLIGARVIRWGLNTDCSHFAVAFDETAAGGGIVFHSTHDGLGVMLFKDFMKINRIVHSLVHLTVPTLAQEEMAYQDILTHNPKASYDYGALSYWIFSALWSKMTGRPLPKKNLWQSNRDFLCTEVAPKILHRINVMLPTLDYAMLEPHELFKLLCQTGKFIHSADWDKTANEG